MLERVRLPEFIGTILASGMSYSETGDLGEVLISVYPDATRGVELRACEHIRATLMGVRRLPVQLWSGMWPDAGVNAIVSSKA